MSHTPGPWEVYEHVLGEVVSIDSGLIASASCPSTGHPFETIANARLIAAAPTMLAALKALHKCGIINPSNSVKYAKAIEASREAMLMAENEA